MNGFVITASIADADISIDIGETQISEGSDNGAWVRAWVWVDFSNTLLDKES